MTSVDAYDHGTKVIVSFVEPFIVSLLLAAHYYVVYNPMKHSSLAHMASRSDGDVAASCASCKMRRDSWRLNVADETFLVSFRWLVKRLGRCLPVSRFL